MSAVAKEMMKNRLMSRFFCLDTALFLFLYVLFFEKVVNLLPSCRASSTDAAGSCVVRFKDDKEEIMGYLTGKLLGCVV